MSTYLPQQRPLRASGKASPNQTFVVELVTANGNLQLEHFQSPLAASDAAESWSEVSGGVTEIHFWFGGEYLRRFVDGRIELTERWEDELEPYVRGWGALQDLSTWLDEFEETMHLAGSSGVENDDPF